MVVLTFCGALTREVCKTVCVAVDVGVTSTNTVLVDECVVRGGGGATTTIDVEAAPLTVVVL